MSLVPKQPDKPNSKSIVPYWDIKNIRLYLLKTFGLAFIGIGHSNRQYYQLYTPRTQLEVKTTISKYEMGIQSLKSCISRVKKVNYLINQVDRRRHLCTMEVIKKLKI